MLAGALKRADMGILSEDTHPEIERIYRGLAQHDAARKLHLMDSMRHTG